MPTFAWAARFGTDFDALTQEQKTQFLLAVKQFVEDLRSGQPVRNGLRVKGVKGTAGVLEMTWAGDGRATFTYGQPVVPGQVHIVWRRVGTHANPASTLMGAG